VMWSAHQFNALCIEGRRRSSTRATVALA